MSEIYENGDIKSIPFHLLPPDLREFFEPDLCSSCYVCHILEVFRAVRRVLADDGTCWVVIGDSFAGSWGNQGRKGTRGGQRPVNGPMLQRVDDARYPSAGSGTGTIRDADLKPKDLMLTPARVALALQADGWWLRSEVIWEKPNPMPSSVRDRPTMSHEHVFMLAKSSQYFFDGDAVCEPTSGTSHGSPRINPGRKNIAVRGDKGTLGKWTKADEAYGRNLRTVWWIATVPYAGAHFACFPPALVEPMILAGTSAAGRCPRCAAPWARLVKKPANIHPGSSHDHTRDLEQGGTQTLADGKAAGSIMRERFHAGRVSETIGWRPSCACDAGPPVPETVLDPFAGSGTTGVVAERLGRRSILIEASEEYCALAKQRLEGGK